MRCRSSRSASSTKSRFRKDSWRLWICYFADSASAEWRMAGKMEPWAHSSEARFADYVDALTAVLGREDRAGPLKDYCIGLLMRGERKSVEPMAAVVGRLGFRPSINRFCIWSVRRLGRMRRISPKCANSSCRRSRRKGRSRRGLSTTRASRRKAFIRWGSRGNIAGGPARPTIVRSR